MPKLFIALALLLSIQRASADFQRTVNPFLGKYCLDCHNPEKKKGDLSLSNLSASIIAEKNGSLWASILDQIQSEEMPPNDADKIPSGKERLAITEWIKTELGHAGFERDPDLLRRPEFGNHVRHEKLFGGSEKPPSFSVPRIWRLRAELVRMGSPFSKTEIDYSDFQSLAEPETMRLRALSEDIATQLLEYMLGRKKKDRRHQKNLPALRVYALPDLANPNMYTKGEKVEKENIKKDILSLFRSLLQREPEPEELNRYSQFLTALLESEEDREGCLATVMRALIMTPEALFRLEIGSGETDEHGRRMLSPRELAYAVPMAFGLTKLEGGLETRDDVEKRVRKIIEMQSRKNGPGSNKNGVPPRFMEFMRWYFGYHKAIEVFKGDRNKRHSEKIAESLVGEADALVAKILREDKDVFKQLLTSNLVLAGKRVDRNEKVLEVFDHYDVDWKWDLVPKKKASRKVFLAARNVYNSLSYLSYYGIEIDDPTNPKSFIESPVPRSGILTHPSWLIAQSTFTDNHVVLRGKWVREKLLGGSIPEVPVGVDAAIPDDPDKSIRDRLKSTRDATCWRCHVRMDPLGYPFELYDDFGRYRKNKKERYINGELAKENVDTSGHIFASRAPGLDGPVEDAIDLLQKISKSDRARQVFVRHVFRFFMGRNETIHDAQSLVRADSDFVQSGESFKDLVASILTSDSFLYRKTISYEK